MSSTPIESTESHVTNSVRMQSAPTHNATFGSFLTLLQTSIIDANNQNNARYTSEFLKHNFSRDMMTNPKSDTMAANELANAKEPIDANTKEPIDANTKEPIDANAKVPVYTPEMYRFNISGGLSEPTLVSIPTLTMGQHNHVKIKDIDIETIGQLIPTRGDSQALAFKRSTDATQSTNDKISIKISITEPPESVSRLIDKFNDSF